MWFYSLFCLLIFEHLDYALGRLLLFCHKLKPYHLTALKKKKLLHFLCILTTPRHKNSTISKLISAQAQAISDNQLNIQQSQRGAHELFRNGTLGGSIAKIWRGAGKIKGLCKGGKHKTGNYNAFSPGSYESAMRCERSVISGETEGQKMSMFFPSWEGEP